MTERSLHNPPAGICWIASYPRSGNTWLRHFLSNIISIPNDIASKPVHINELGDYSVWDIDASNYENVLQKPIKYCSRNEISAARPIVQKNLADHSDELAYVKTHNMLIYDGKYPTINTSVTSGAIYIVRNPLDIVISIANHYSIDLDSAITFMALCDAETDVSDKSVYEIYGSWSQNVSSWTSKPHPAILTISYEDMLTKPTSIFGAICRHLSIDANQEHLEQAIEFSSFCSAKAQENEDGYVARPQNTDHFFRAGRSGQWQAALSTRQIDRVIQSHHTQMDRFGYLDID